MTSQDRNDRLRQLGEECMEALRWASALLFCGAWYASPITTESESASSSQSAPDVWGSRQGPRVHITLRLQCAMLHVQHAVTWNHSV
ncbi:hypothetical protein BaRGS_00006774 [Batillaria attramentaria]|uniref:Uncharacterized protein n=1 Tax=Batillaria attramentaria TaxID=370345 RepID=A0ABD0LRF3_9CAEN